MSLFVSVQCIGRLNTSRSLSPRIKIDPTLSSKFFSLVTIKSSNVILSDFTKSNLSGDEITTLRVRGKGGKERIVPLGKFAVTAIENYLVRTRPELAAKSGRKESSMNGALFLNQKGTRISRQSAWQIVLTAAERAGITSKVSPHVFRHSYATHLLDGGADIRVVQELLGHASVNTTQIYTLITIDKIRESYSSAHPRAR